MNLRDKNSNSIAGLSAERAKALEAIEKYSFLNRTKDKTKSIEFEPDEMNARSTALQRNEKIESLNSASDSVRNCSRMPSVDQMFATSICGSLNFDDEEFQSADLMSSVMKRDEMSYYEKYAHIPGASHNTNDRNETWFDRAINQNSIGDFFVNENSLLLNFKSPPRTVSPPFALINLTNSCNISDTASSRSHFSLSALMKDVNIDSNIGNKLNPCETHNTFTTEKSSKTLKENIEQIHTFEGSRPSDRSKNIISNMYPDTLSSIPKISTTDCDHEYDKEYEEFLGSPLTKNRTKKRHKSKSPNLLSKNKDHLSSTRIEAPIDCERFYNNSSPNNFGKMSLPTYELANCVVQKKGSPNSSLFSHRDGKKLPLKIDKFSIAWGSVKLRKLEKQSIQIKNVSPKRLQFKINVRGPGFDVLNLQGNLLTLQAMECRTIELSFCPTVLGLAVGSLTFGSPNSADIPEIPIKLCGFGGHIIIQHNFGVTASPVGLPFVSLGVLTDLNETVRSTFAINNKGTIHAFFTILIDQVGMDLPGICDSISVKPMIGIIPPRGEVNIVVSYKATRNDLKRIVGKIKNKNALSIANLQILHGDEATRIRIKRMIPELKRTKELPKSLDKMWDISETPSIIESNDTFKESADSVYDLIPTLKTRDISIIISNSIWDNEDQSTILMPDVDETILFRTIIENHDA
ncbi:spd-2 family protein [Megaselia abdita]